jgi:hypothetical protein
MLLAFSDGGGKIVSLPAKRLQFRGLPVTVGRHNGQIAANTFRLGLESSEGRRGRSCQLYQAFGPARHNRCLVASLRGIMLRPLNRSPGFLSANLRLLLCTPGLVCPCRQLG